MLNPDTQGPASMPLEILLNIGGYVAGANDYGTLLNFSLVSKIIHEEFRPVPYETMWFADKEGFRSVGTERYSDIYKFAK